MDNEPKRDDPAQSQRFIDMAREVEASDKQGAFDSALMKVAIMTPEAPQPERKKQKRNA